MEISKLNHIKDIKYSGIHPLDKKKLIKKINNYIDSYNDSQQVILNYLNNPDFSKYFEKLIYEKLTKKINEEIQSATLKNGKNTLKEIDKNVGSIIESTSGELLHFKKIISETNNYTKNFFSNVSKTLELLKADVYQKDLENLAYLVTPKISEKEMEKCLSSCSEKEWNDILKNIKNTFETTLKNSLEDLKSTIALINEKHLSQEKIDAKISHYVKENFDEKLNKKTGREHLGGSVRNLYDKHLDEIENELKEIFKKIHDDEIKSVHDLIELGLKNSNPNKYFKIVYSAVKGGYETLNKKIKDGEYGLKEFNSKTIPYKIDEIVKELN